MGTRTVSVIAVVAAFGLAGYGAAGDVLRPGDRSASLIPTAPPTTAAPPAATTQATTAAPTTPPLTAPSSTPPPDSTPSTPPPDSTPSTAPPDLCERTDGTFGLCGDTERGEGPAWAAERDWTEANAAAERDWTEANAAVEAKLTEIGIAEEHGIVEADLVDVAYGPEAAHRLDVHLPPAGTAHGGAIVHVHGGAWVGGDKAFDPDELMIRSLVADHGWTVFAVGYRTAPADPFPAALHDVNRAMRWVKANADRYGVDPARVMVCGWSAGGHLAVMLAATADDPAMQPGDLGPLTSFSPAPAAVVSLSAPLDPRAWGDSMAVDNPFSGSAAIAAFAGCVGPTHLTCTDEQLDAIDVSTYAGPATAPLHLAHGDLDGIVPFASQLAVVDRLSQQLAPVAVTFDAVTAGPTEHRNHAVDLALDVDALLGFLDRVASGSLLAP